MSANLMSLLVSKSAPLPYDAEVEYIQSTSQQYINLFTNKQTGLDYEFEIGMQFHQTISSGYIGTGMSLSVEQAFVGLNGNANTGLYMCFASGTGGTILSKIDAPNEYHVFKAVCSAGTVRYYVDGALKFTASTASYLLQTFGLFQMGSTRGFLGQGRGDMRISFCRIHLTGTTLDMDMIAVRKDGIGYMYDRVSGKFYGNDGTGAFVIGPDKERSLVLSKLFGDRKMVNQGYTARDYVQDGLVALFDGIENAGWGVHDSSLDGWKNLVGNSSADDASRSFDERAVAPMWSSNCFYNDGSALRSIAATNPLYGLTANTIEFVFKVSANGFKSALMLRDGSALSNSIIISTTDGIAYLPISKDFPWNYATRVSVDASDGLTYSISSNLDSGRDYHVWYANGIEKTSISLGGGSISRIFTASDTRIVFGSYLPWNAGIQFALDGDIYCTRLYNRVLSASEIAANYEIDKARFNLP